MTNKHWQIISLLLGGLALQLMAVHHWNEVMSPGFIGGFLAMASGTLRALYTDKPARPNGDD